MTSGDDKKKRRAGAILAARADKTRVALPTAHPGPPKGPEDLPDTGPVYAFPVEGKMSKREQELLALISEKYADLPIKRVVSTANTAYGTSNYERKMGFFKREKKGTITLDEGRYGQEIADNERVLNSFSIPDDDSVFVAAHETGHAIQDVHPIPGGRYSDQLVNLGTGEISTRGQIDADVIGYLLSRKLGSDIAVKPSKFMEIHDYAGARSTKAPSRDKIIRLLSLIEQRKQQLGLNRP